MKINDNWKFEDLVTGLKFSAIPGEKLDTLHIENIKGGCDNRDLWFTKDGGFGGTGSELLDTCGVDDDINPDYEQARADQQ